jgi:hypothetical protein
MIALIGGGLLALGAIVGLTIWLVSGDDKKSGTASSGSSSPPATSPAGGPGGSSQGPPPAGGGGMIPPMPGSGGSSQGPPPIGGGGMIPPMPGSGGSPVDAGGWQPFAVDGLSANLPGVPTEQHLPGAAGADMKMYLLKAGGNDSGFFVGRVVMPPEASAVPAKTILDEAARGAERSVGGFGFGRANDVGIGGKSDITQDGFPGKEIQLTDKKNRGGGGVLRFVIAGNKMYLYGAASDNFANFKTQSDQFLASVKINAQGGGIAMGPGGGIPPMPGSGGSSQGPPPIGGGSGMIPPMPGAGGSSQGPPPIGGGSFPTPGMGGSSQGPPPIGGGGIPPMPGGGGIIPPMPGSGGSSQGPPPIGGGGIPPMPGGGGIIPPMPGGGGIPPFPGSNPGASQGDTGKLAKSINPYFVGVFDADKKELITVSGRVDKGKAAGELTRYSYPDFLTKGTVRIPSVATRAVVDSKKQLIYLTTVGNIRPEVIGPERYDRPAVAGSIAVYDLGAMRSGKVEEKSDVKPLATVDLGVGRVVRDLVLSPDGKTLYALTSAAKGKSQVAAIDTTTRKVDKTKDLPDPAWEMVLRPTDGKLLVTHLQTNPAGAAGITVVDPATMTIAATLALQEGWAYNAAVTKDGRVVVSVPGTGNAPLSLKVVEPNKPNAAAVKAAGTGQSNNGYVAVSPDGKFLIVSSHHPEKQGGGLDVYETSDSSMGEKKVSSMKKAGTMLVGGTFLVGPDSDYVVFNTGAVLKLDDLGTTPGTDGGTVGGGIGDNPGGMGGLPLPPPAGGVGGNPGFPPPANGGGMGGLPLPPPAGGVNPGNPGIPPMPGGVNPGVVPPMPGAPGAIPPMPGAPGAIPPMPGATPGVGTPAAPGLPAPVGLPATGAGTPPGAAPTTPAPIRPPM